MVAQGSVAGRYALFRGLGIRLPRFDRLMSKTDGDALC
jgi:hypothetical protein